MNREKALKTLGLKDDFTEEELKKAYKSLARKFHPDYAEANGLSEEEAKEKMQDINAAYDYFDKLKKETGNYENYFDLNNYKDQVLAKMMSFYRNTTVGDITLINSVKNAYKYWEDPLFFRHTKEDVDEVYRKFLDEVKIVYSNYKNDYYRDNYISEADVKEKINYNCNVEEFYKQLCNIKNKYSGEVLFETRVKDEIYKYQFYATYNKHIGDLISTVCVRNAKISAKNNGYKNIDAVIAKMHSEIANLFKLVDEINSKFNSLKQELSNINDEALNNEYEKLKRRYDRGDALDDILIGLDTLNKKQEDYKKEQERLAKMNEDESITNGLYSRLLGKFNNALANLNPVSENEKIKECLNLFQNVMDLFFKYRNGIISLEKLIMLDELTFANSLNDSNIVEIISGNVISSKDVSKIYLKKSEFCNLMFDENSFFILSKENGEYIIKRMALAHGCYENVITLDELRKKYISLDEVLNNARYVGKYGNQFKTISFFVLYEISIGEEKRYLTLAGDKIFICREYGLSILDNSPQSNEYNDNEYNDKEYVKSIIERQVFETFRENESAKKK